MIDPLTALSIATTAFGQIKELIGHGQDITSALSKFAGAMADLSYAEDKAKNPPWWKSLTGSPEEEAIEIFMAKKKAEEMKRDIETLIGMYYGHSGLESYKNTLRQVREQRRKHEYRKAEIKEKIINVLIIGTVVISTTAFAVFVFWWYGKTQGKW